MDIFNRRRCRRRFVFSRMKAALAEHRRMPFMTIVAVFTMLLHGGCHNRSCRTPLEIYQSDPSFQEFIETVCSAPHEERQALVDSFMRDASGESFPLREDTLAHFVYRGDVSSGVSVPGDFNGWNPGADPMNGIEGTDFFYLTKRFEIDARLDYKFVLNGSQWIIDPLNPRTVTGGFGPNSELAMPGYRQPEEIIYYVGFP
jgi:enterochelin esterase family protein